MSRYATLLEKVHRYHPLPWTLDHVVEDEPANEEDPEPFHFEGWAIRDKEGREVMTFGHNYDGSPLDWLAAFIVKVANGDEERQERD